MKKTKKQLENEARELNRRLDIAHANSMGRIQGIRDALWCFEHRPDFAKRMLIELVDFYEKKLTTSSN